MTERRHEPLHLRGTDDARPAEDRLRKAAREAAICLDIAIKNDNGTTPSRVRLRERWEAAHDNLIAALAASRPAPDTRTEALDVTKVAFALHRTLGHGNHGDGWDHGDGDLAYSFMDHYDHAPEVPARLSKEDTCCDRRSRSVASVAVSRFGWRPMTDDARPSEDRLRWSGSPNAAADLLFDELAESPLPGARYALRVVRDRLPAILAASRPAPDTRTEALDVERLGEAIFRVGTGYRDRTTATVAARIANSQDGARASGEFAEAVAAEYDRLAALSPSKGSDPAAGDAE